MANNNTNTTTEKKAKPVKSAGWFLNLIGFVAVICVGISLLFSRFSFMGKVAGALATIAQVISYIILIALSCFYIVRRKNIWLWIVWAVSVVLIVISFII